jgi:hypothetical protein
MPAVTVKITNVPRKRKKRLVKVTKKKKDITHKERENVTILQPGESQTEDLIDGETLKIEEGDETEVVVEVIPPDETA